MLTVLFSNLLLASLGTPPGLVDNPIVGDSIQYLDGSWSASAKGGPSTNCDFADNTDWKGDGDGEPVGASSKEDCCGICDADSTCVAATFYQNQCWVKTASQASESYSRNGRVSCKKGGSAGTVAYSIDAKVPGDLLTDLQSAGLIGDPLFELNFKNATLWDKYAWTYSTTFTLGAGNNADADATHLLVFDGIKMGANIRVNGQLLGTANDQFLRYVFAMPATLLKAGAANQLEVEFAPTIDCGGRWMSCTGGWDWAPYSNTFQDGAHTFSKGIWKSVSVVTLNSASSAALTHIVPQVLYQGTHPTTPLADGSFDDFEVNVRTHFFVPSGPTSGKLLLTGSWGEVASEDITLPQGESSYTLKVKATAAQVKLWWPVNYGSQPLYNISVTFTPSSKGTNGRSVAAVSSARRVGFRVFALVTGNDTDPEYVKEHQNTDGTDLGGHGMFWRVNGAVVYSKGANMIPMEELEGRMDDTPHKVLVQSAVDASMNTLRVWGGGMFLPDVWYDACDELGIMVYHDMQYAQSGHSPQNTTAQDAELRHQIRRLSHHPSIVMWDGCNECRVIIGTNTGIYATFVMTVVAEEDQSRVVWPSCPALGWTGGVNRLNSLPNGKPLLTPSKGTSIELHGPYQHGTGFPAVNGASNEQLFDANLPISVSQQQTGAAYPNVFYSEFGSSVFSSFESMAPTLRKEHWGVHAGMAPDNCTGGFASKCVGDNPMSDRNYPCDNIIDVYFGSKKGDFDLVGEEIFKKHLWQCMVGQALLIKSNIETRRSSNEFGTIVWQYNEIWPTGGWGSIEYGTVGWTDGQVIGGRWKPLQYWYKNSIFADVMATCGKGGQCYVKNDMIRPFKGSVSIEYVSLNATASSLSTSVTRVHSMDVSMEAGAGTTEYFQVNLTDAQNTALSNGGAILKATVIDHDDDEDEDEDPTPVCQHPILYTAPKNLALSTNARVEFDVQRVGRPGGIWATQVTVTSDKVALFVTLTTAAQGRFSDNAFLLLPGQPKALEFIPFPGYNENDLKTTLRVEHAGGYM